MTRALVTTCVHTRCALDGGGVLAMNSIGHRRGPALASLGRTLRTVFRHVRAFATVPEGPITNVVFFASDAPLDLPWAFEDEVRGLAVELTGGEVLTDQRNPVNHWNAPWAREIRRTRGTRY